LVQIYIGLTDFHQILHIHVLESLSKLVQGFLKGWGAKFGLSLFRAYA